MSRRAHLLITAVVLFGVWMASPSAEAGVAPESPTLAPSPHDIRKNRYISIDPRGANGTNPNTHHIRVTLDSTEVLGVDAGQVGSVWWANPHDIDNNDPPVHDCISLVGPDRPFTPPNWAGCPVLHLTGCAIIPTTTYKIVAVVDGQQSLLPLTAKTQLRPADNKWWGDAVGFFNGAFWTGPQGVTNFDDVRACLLTFQSPTGINATHTSVTDIHPNRPDLGGLSAHPNKIVSSDDIFQFIQGFRGHEYPGGDLAGCTNP